MKLLEILKSKLGFKVETPSNKDFSTFAVSKQELNDIALKVERFNKIQEGKAEYKNPCSYCLGVGGVSSRAFLPKCKCKDF